MTTGTLWILMVLIPGHLIAARYDTEAKCKLVMAKVIAIKPTFIIAAQCVQKPNDDGLAS